MLAEIPVRSNGFWGNCGIAQILCRGIAVTGLICAVKAHMQPVLDYYGLGYQRSNAKYCKIVLGVVAGLWV